jgi:hypothetical protein
LDQAGIRIIDKCIKLELDGSKKRIMIDPKDKRFFLTRREKERESLGKKEPMNSTLLLYEK